VGGFNPSPTLQRSSEAGAGLYTGGEDNQSDIRAALAEAASQNTSSTPTDNRDWRYVLLGEASFYDWQSKGGRLADLLDFARVRPAGNVAAQQALI
jgi:type III restriction enzyme